MYIEGALISKSRNIALILMTLYPYGLEYEATVYGSIKHELGGQSQCSIRKNCYELCQLDEIFVPSG